MALASVTGIGIIPFGKHSEKSIIDMGATAGYLALKDAGIEPSKIQAGFFANGLAGRLFGDSTIGQNVFWELGINKIPVVNVENACT
ncbi:MAG: thiolase family protein, partial [Desulfobacteraceae bacterium]|nr:thiolase family protein [Desulfobacteraceae bacterium]